MTMWLGDCVAQQLYDNSGTAVDETVGVYLVVCVFTRASVCM